MGVNDKVEQEELELRCKRDKQRQEKRGRFMKLAYCENSLRQESEAKAVE